MKLVGRFANGSSVGSLALLALDAWNTVFSSFESV